MHSSVEHSPSYSSGVLSLEEEGFGLAILETEDFAVTTDVELALFTNCVSPVSNEWCFIEAQC